MQPPWQKHTFPLVMVSSCQFVLLTLIAMFFYTGGTLADPTVERYSFSTNFFSDLGILTSYNGETNLIASILFFIALALAGLGLVYFFVIFPTHFQEDRYGRFLSIFGSVFGVIAGLSYVGVAGTPADHFLAAHVTFVQTAFSTFLVPVICYTAAIFLHPDYPNQYGGIFLAFAALLAVYLWLLFGGPDLDTENGVLIQAIGQKIIVYAAIITIFLQAYGAHRFTAKTEASTKHLSRSTAA